MGIKNTIVKGFSLLKPIPLKDKIINYASFEVAVKEIFVEIKKKEPKITRTDVPENNNQKVFSALGALNLKNWLVTNYTTLMNNIRDSLTTLIDGKLSHGGYGGTGQTLFNLIESAKTNLTSLINANKSKLENLGDKVVENFGAGDDPSGITTIQQTGAKIAGYRYFDTANKVAFKCIKNNTLTYADSDYYVAIDNNSLRDQFQALLTTCQNWKDVTNQRENNTIYTNDTGKTIKVSIYQITTYAGSFKINGVEVAKKPTSSVSSSLLFERDVRPSETYEFSFPTKAAYWYEFR